MQRSLVEIDGRTLEGGGQLLRLALSLSALTKVPVHITHIRGNRGAKSSDGGLKTAHLAAAQWLAKATSASTEGMQLKSADLAFRPKHGDDLDATGSDYNPAFRNVIEDGVIIRHESKIGLSTPGSITLILQAILPYLLFGGFDSPVRITIEGGTNVSNSPSIDYVMQVLLPILETRLGLDPIDASIHRRGWSVGRNDIGSVTFDMIPWQRGRKLPSFTLSERGSITRMHVSIIGPDGTLRQVAKSKIDEQMTDAWSNMELNIALDEDSGNTRRFYLLLVAESDTGVRLGCDKLFEMKPPKKSDKKPRRGLDEQIRQIERLTTELIKRMDIEIAHGGCVDSHMQDQLVIFQALTEGTSHIGTGQMNASLHTKTARWVVEETLGIAFTIGECEGIAHRPGMSAEDRADQSRPTLEDGIRHLKLGDVDSP